MIDIIKAKREDAKEILDIQYLVYKSEAELLDNHDIPPLKQTLKQSLEEFDNGVFLKAIDKDGRIIGSVRWHEKAGTVYISKLMVLPDMQGKGIGSALLKEVESLQPCERYELFTSSKSRQNITLYQKHGYMIFREQKIDDALMLVYMEKFSKTIYNEEKFV